tara:strand:+ start:416 stop:733 length:318 start_codon:yes stop_codon:yes gene_type:complete
MRNDAKFIFCFSGFIGFLTFYFTATFLHNDFLFSILHGAIGCMSFAVCGRFFLSIILKSTLVSDKKNVSNSNLPQNSKIPQSDRNHSSHSSKNENDLKTNPSMVN